jgi:hypothetical protein
MSDRDDGMLAFLGVPADPRLLSEPSDTVPDLAPAPPRPASSHQHDRLVAAGSVMTATTLVVGVLLGLYGIAGLLFGSGGASAVIAAALGALLAGTHWGWVHVAEYAGVTIDQRQDQAYQARGQEWLAEVEPYPRFSVSTTVLEDASTRVERTLYRPVLTPKRTFAFVREVEAARTFDAFAPAAAIATDVETLRREARLQTDRVRELWEAAATAYAAALASEADDQQQLVAERAAATALSEHLNASLLEPPVTE